MRPRPPEKSPASVFGLAVAEDPPRRRPLVRKETVPLAPETFLDDLAERGFDLWIGVPCSLLGPFLTALRARTDLEHVPLCNEGEAVAYASGAWLAGRRPVVYLQNSGLGNATNPLTSLASPYDLGMVLVCSWRGQPGQEDAPQHLAMGALTPALLEATAPGLALSGDPAVDRPRVRSLCEQVLAAPRPGSLLVPRGTFQASTGPDQPPVPPRAPPAGHLEDVEAGPPTLTRGQALEVLDEVIGDRFPVVATTGKTSRELHALADRPGHFYMVGSMGCAPTLALAVARHRPGGGPVVCVDGDGAALMRLEAWASVAAYRPAGFVHVLLDNGVHDSTGGQPSLGPAIRFDALAHALGYASSARRRSAGGLRAALVEALDGPGPSLIHVPILPGSPPGLGRPGLPLTKYGRRFRRFLERGVPDDGTEAAG